MNKPTSQCRPKSGTQLAKLEIILVCALFLLAPGCGRQKQSEEISDAALTSQVEAKFQQDATLRTRMIHVTAQRAAVTLSGQVSDESERVSAEKLAGDVIGVKQIVDLLAVAVAQSQPPPSSDQIATGPQATESNPPQPQANAQLKQKQTTKLPAVVEEAPQAGMQASQPASTPEVNASQARTQPTTPTVDLPPVVEEAAQTATPPSNPIAAPQAGTNPPPPILTRPTSASSAPPGAAPSPLSRPASVTISAGTEIPVRMIDAIDSKVNEVGQTFAASVSAAVAVDNQIVILQGADARVRLEEDKSSGRFKGRSLLKVELVAVTANGTTYNVETAPAQKQGASQGKSTGKKVAVGGAAGAALGGIFGGGLGAGIGAAIGAAGGAVEQGLSHAKRVKIESEERLDFALRSPVTIQATGATKP
jgi:hypothetical protein